MPHELPIWALLPAAGASRRLGKDKRLLPWRGQTLLEHSVSILRQAGFDHVMVVLEENSPCAQLAGLDGVVQVINPQPERGMLSSVREGLNALPANVRAVGVQPADHPLIKVEAVRAVVAYFRAHQPLLLLPRFVDRRGHPLIIHRDRFAAALACDDSVGLRQLVARYADDLVQLPLPYAGLEQDLDDADDLRRLRELESS